MKRKFCFFLIFFSCLLILPSCSWDSIFGMVGFLNPSQSENPEDDDKLRYRTDVKEYEKNREKNKKRSWINLSIFKRKDTPEKNFERWLKSAQLGNPGAQMEVATLYEVGKGVEKDYTKAYLWYSLAANQGINEAFSKRNFLVQKMNDDELIKAEKNLINWRKKNIVPHLKPPTCQPPWHGARNAF